MSDDFSAAEDSIVEVDDALTSVEKKQPLEARKRLEMMLEEKRLRDDLDDYFADFGE